MCGGNYVRTLMHARSHTHTCTHTCAHLCVYMCDTCVQLILVMPYATVAGHKRATPSPSDGTLQSPCPSVSCHGAEANGASLSWLWTWKKTARFHGFKSIGVASLQWFWMVQMVCNYLLQVITALIFLVNAADWLCKERRLIAHLWCCWWWSSQLSSDGMIRLRK